MKTLKNITTLTDALSNLSPTSGASSDYNRGLLVGIVSGLMATGLSFEQALQYVAQACPETYKNCLLLLPESWREKTNFSENSPREILLTRDARGETKMYTDTQKKILSIDPTEVPVMTHDRSIARKQRAVLVRTLFKRLGIKGVSVTCPNYSMARSVDIHIGSSLGTAEDYNFEGVNYSQKAFSEMPDKTPIKIKHNALIETRRHLEKIILAAFPAHFDRSDSMTDYFDNPWSIN